MADRDALLKSINKGGIRLKKTVTNDRSAPMLKGPSRDIKQQGLSSVSEIANALKNGSVALPFKLPAESKPIESVGTYDNSRSDGPHKKPSMDKEENKSPPRPNAMKSFKNMLNSSILGKGSNKESLEKEKESHLEENHGSASNNPVISKPEIKDDGGKHMIQKENSPMQRVSCSQIPKELGSGASDAEGTFHDLTKTAFTFPPEITKPRPYSYYKPTKKVYPSGQKYGTMVPNMLEFNCVLELQSSLMEKIDIIMSSLKTKLKFLVQIEDFLQCAAVKEQIMVLERIKRKAQGGENAIKDLKRLIKTL